MTSMNIQCNKVINIFIRDKFFIMDTRQYKNSGEQISLLGLGCMRLPRKGSVGQKIDRKLAQEMVDFAMKSGINYYDTAYIYHMGDAEDFIGEALSKYPRKSFKLATKLPTWLLRRESDVEKYLEKQLEKCQVDYFDYYLIHNLTEKTVTKLEKYNVVDILRKKQAEGKIKKLGFSFHGKVPLLRELVEKYEWDFAQIQLNYIDWDMQDAKTQYNILTDAGIPVIIMEPVRGGLLAKLNQKCAKIFSAANPDVSMASWAVRYAASLPNVLTVLSGMSDMAQLQDNIGTLSDFKPLSQAEYSVINKVLAAYKKSSAIPCTACRYCMPCPSGVNIPTVFDLYNVYRLTDNRQGFDFDMGSLPEKERPEACVKCGKCEKLCPQGIKIQEALEKISLLK